MKSEGTTKYYGLLHLVIAVVISEIRKKGGGKNDAILYSHDSIINVALILKVRQGEKFLIIFIKNLRSDGSLRGEGREPVTFPASDTTKRTEDKFVSMALTSRIAVKKYNLDRTT
jgi:hypothetical protein